MPKSAGVDDQLRQAIRESGVPPYLIAEVTGVSNPSLYRFLSGERGLTLDSVAKLCRYLGLELAPIRPKVPKRKEGKA